MLTPILNRASGANPPLTDDTWIQIAPIGEFANQDHRLTQIVDAEAIQVMANRFSADSRDPNFPGVPIDYDHGIFDRSKSSAAAGWMKTVEARADGLWAQVRWTSDGHTKVADGSYKFVSPVWYRQETKPAGPGRVRPQRLVAAALTNNPNLTGMQPITNRQAEAEDSANPHMSKLNTLLGLAPEASEEAACENITNLLARAKAGDAMTNRAATLEAENISLREREADALILSYGSRIPEAKRPEVRTAILNHRKDTLAILTLLPDPAPQSGAGVSPATPMLNRSACGVPTTAPGGQADPAVTAAVAEARKAKALSLQAQLHCSWDEAWKAAV